jgi:hypothetical protein
MDDVTAIYPRMAGIDGWGVELGEKGDGTVTGTIGSKGLVKRLGAGGGRWVGKRCRMRC